MNQKKRRRAKARLLSDFATPGGVLARLLEEGFPPLASAIDAIATRGKIAVVVFEASESWRDALRMQGWKGQKLFAMGERMRTSLSLVDPATEQWMSTPRPEAARIFAVVQDTSLLLNFSAATGYTLEPGSIDDDA